MCLLMFISFQRVDILSCLVSPQDQRSTVISIQKLIVREVANEERGLYMLNLLLEHLINKHKSSD